MIYWFQQLSTQQNIYSIIPLGSPWLLLLAASILYFFKKKKVLMITTIGSHWQWMAPHSSTLAWKMPWTEEPSRLQSMRSLRVRHDWATSLHFSLSRIGEGNGIPLQCSCLENPGDGGAWWAAVYGVAQSRTRLKRLSSSSTYRARHPVVWTQAGTRKHYYKQS